MSAAGQSEVAVMSVPRRRWFENVRADVRRAALDMNLERHEPSSREKFSAFFRINTQLVVAYRFQHWARGVRVLGLGLLLRISAAIFYRILGTLTGSYIAADAEIGPGLLVHTTYGLNVGGTKIGANCTVQSGVLIAAGSRGIGDNVYFGAGAKLIGDARIGNNVVVVANSLVLTDVPDNTTIVGVPARIKLRGGRPQRFKKVAATEPKRNS
jgi:serine O-acetyltransferase